MPTCPSCAQENPDIAQFCLACGKRLAAPEPAHEERRVVTVIFVDLVGFTSRAEQLDPEDVRAILTPYYERVRGEIESFGGVVEKFIGDAVMGVFGAPDDLWRRPRARGSRGARDPRRRASPCDRTPRTLRSGSR